MTLIHKAKVQLLQFSKDAKFLFSSQYLSPFKNKIFIGESFFKELLI
jgi:hypothetical protein